MKGYEYLYSKNAEWSELNAKVCSYRRMINDLRELQRELWFSGQSSTTVSRKINGYNLALNRAIDKLNEIERQIRHRYNMAALAYDCPCCMDDSYYENKFRRDGYIRAIKF